MNPSVHIPIMAEPILAAFKEGLEKFSGNVVLIDATFGGGGHTGIFLRDLPSRVKILALDQDEGPILRGQTQFKDEIASGRLHLKHINFGDLTRDEFPEALRNLPLGAILADLGFSSDQLEDPERGISFQREGPLDMRLNRQKGATAWDVVHELSERELADIIYKYGEERMSRKISMLIKSAIRSKTLENSTTALASLVERAFPPKLRHGRIHAATRTFQALRIFVNQELGALENLLGSVILNLDPGGRAAILSFHSLEDRAVKLAFREREIWRALTKKPIEADEAELERNSRSRSAKLRIAEKL